MFEPDQPFYQTIGEALRLSGLSLTEISAALRQRGFSIGKATLSRWTTGTQPSLQHLGALRCLPEVLDLSLAHRTAFQRALSRWLSEVAGVRSSAALAYRQNTLGVVPSFVGRTTELPRLQTLVTQRRSVAITGLGGIGKTTLARQLLLTCAGDFASGCEALVLHADQSAVGVITQVARRLGLNLPGDVEAASRAELLDWLAGYVSGADVLFLLDDVSAETQVDDLVQRLPGITWVLTSRRPLTLHRLEALSLDTLSNDEAARLLLTQAGLALDGAHRPLAEQIARRLSNLPLAVDCAAGLTTLLGSLTAVLELLSAGGLDALQLDYANLPRFFDRMLERSSPGTRAVLELCGAFALPRISADIFLSLADRLQLHPAGLLALKNLSLVKWPEGTEFFVLHPLVHEYAAHRLRRAPRSLDIRRFFSAHYADLARTWRDSAPSELEAELENVLAAADYAYAADDWECVRRFWSPITWQLWVTGDKPRYVAYDVKFLEAARLQHDQATEATILAELAWIYLERGDLAEADQALENLLALCDALPDGGLRRALALRYQAKVATKRDDPALALALLSASETVLRSLGPVADRAARSLALVYSIRVKIAQAARQGEGAILNAFIALQFFRQAGAAGKSYLSSSLLDVGDILEEYGKGKQAEPYWRSAAACDAHFAEDASVGTAQARLAYLAAERGCKEEALRLGHSAHQIYLRRGAMRHHLRLGDWLRNYEDDDEIGPLLDLARLED